MSVSDQAASSSAAAKSSKGQNPFRDMSDLDSRYTPGEAFVQLGLPILAIPTLVYFALAYNSYEKRAARPTFFGYIKYAFTCCGRCTKRGIPKGPTKKATRFRPLNLSNVPVSPGQPTMAEKRNRPAVSAIKTPQELNQQLNKGYDTEANVFNVELRDAEVKKMAEEADGFFAASSPAKLPTYDSDQEFRDPRVDRTRNTAPSRAGSPLATADLSPTSRPAYSTGRVVPKPPRSVARASTVRPRQQDEL